LVAQAMASQLAPLGLRMKEIKADGHCMYRSLEHQLQGDPAASSPPSFQQLRVAAAEYMRTHPDTFSPFIEVGCPVSLRAISPLEIQQGFLAPSV
jgi:OTU domain-containing protein 6